MGRNRFISCAALLLAAAGCTPVRDFISHEPEPEQVFSVGFRQIAERYIEPVDMRRATLTGLKKIAAMEPEAVVGVEDERGTIGLRVRYAIVAQWPRPNKEDHQAWAELAANFLSSLRRRVPSARTRPNEDIYEAVFKGALTGLDKYSRYATAERARQRQAARDGFGGLGISIKYNDGETSIATVHPETPAQRAGLRAKDVITHVEGRAIHSLRQNAVVALLRGPIHSRVRLTLRRPGSPRPVLATVTRDLILIPTVKAQTEKGLLILKVSGFNSGTTRNLRKKARSAFRQHGGALNGVVLDLRGNPGGLLTQAVSVADLFLEDGSVVSTRGRHRASYQEFDASRGDIAKGLPLVVIVNGRSASSAEIVAAALRDRGRAVVVGSSSYGKGSVQTITRLPNGGEMTLTWATLITPAGNKLQSRGVIPSICTNGGKMTAWELRRAVLAGQWTPPSARISHSRAKSDPRDGYRRLRAACPPVSARPSMDVEIARLVVANTKLYRKIVNTNLPTVAAKTLPPSG